MNTIEIILVIELIAALLAVAILLFVIRDSRRDIYEVKEIIHQSDIVSKRADELSEQFKEMVS